MPDEHNNRKNLLDRILQMEWQTKTFTIGEHTISLRLPKDDESVLSAAIAGECVDPYWGKVWSSAVDSANCIFNLDWKLETTVLELGCGVGLTGIAALLSGLDVTFSDHDPRAVEIAVENAALNGFANAKGMVLDWAQPLDSKFDLLLGSDLLYEVDSHRLLLDVGQKMLNPGCQMCIGDPGRQLARNFLDQATNRGWNIQIVDKQLNSAMIPFNNQFQWLTLSRE